MSQRDAHLEALETVRAAAEAAAFGGGEGSRERHMKRGKMLPRERVANLLAWQVRQRRVRRVGRGILEAVPGAFARTTRWRIDNWERVAERR